MRRVKFRLAALLGMTVGELEMRMSAREFSEWIELLRVDPWGPYRSDLQHALTAWSPIAAAGGKAKVEDFLPSDRSEDWRTQQTASIDDLLRETGAKITRRA
jgi:hypothetical protein